MAKRKGLTVRGREMQRVVAEWERSGLTMREFGARHGLTVSTLAWWRSQLKRRGSEAEAADKPIELVELDLASAAGGHSSFELQLGNGLLVRVPAGFEPGALRRLLGVLGVC